LLAYWDILHAHDRRGFAGRRIRPSDLRLMSTASATLGDIIEAWMLTRPRKEKTATAQSSIQKMAASPAAAKWWST